MIYNLLLDGKSFRTPGVVGKPTDELTKASIFNSYKNGGRIYAKDSVLRISCDYGCGLIIAHSYFASRLNFSRHWQFVAWTLLL